MPEPISPDNRPIKRRRGARVVIVSGDEVLLQRDRDPGLPGSDFWQTPGGGIDDGESPRAAAAREVLEETGLHVDPDALLGPIATRTVTHGYTDRILIQHETFFLLHTARFRPFMAGLTARETERRVATEWHRLDDLPSPVWPGELARLTSWDGGGAVDLGDVEESTVPVSRVAHHGDDVGEDEAKADQSGEPIALAQRTRQGLPEQEG